MKIKNTVLSLYCLLLIVVVQAGSIKVNYKTTGGSSWQQNEIDAFERAAKHWAAVLNSPHEIRVDAYYRNLIAANGNDSSYLGVLGYARANYTGSNFTSTDGKYQANTTYVVALAEKLKGSTYANVDYHIVINMNKINAIKWYFGISFSGIGSREYDFTTVVLHELAHGLGFVSSANLNSTSNLAEYNQAEPHSMDRFIYKNLGAIDMTTLAASGSATHSFLTSNTLYFKGSDASSKKGGLRPQIYAPATWISGSSLSHWHLGSFGPTNKDKLMEPQAGFANRYFFRLVGKVTRGFMNDIGWDVLMSVDENILAKNIKVFPNPSARELNIYIDNDVGSLQLSIHSITGRTFYKTKLTGNQIAIPVENWNNGMYTLEILNTKTGNVHYQKFIKTN